MASAEKLKALIESYTDEDPDRFRALALQMAAHEARIGHGKLAQEIRDLVMNPKKKPRPPQDALSVASSSTHISAANKQISDLTELLSPTRRLSDLILPQQAKVKLERIILEQRQFDKLRNHGLQPRHKLLLIGPPGTGKTLTAEVLANELSLPFYTVRLDAVITKFMGESAAKLRQIFDAIKSVRGVYLFDEFDAIGSQRSSDSDVGEARRILNSFLLMIEKDNSNSLIMAATNHPSILDAALYRRFDDIIQYELPQKEQIEVLLKNRLTGALPRKFSWEKVLDVAAGLSGADITRAANEALKDKVLSNSTYITAPALQSALCDRKKLSNQS